jgi:hypothetical protein
MSRHHQSHVNANTRGSYLLSPTSLIFIYGGRRDVYHRCRTKRFLSFHPANVQHFSSLQAYRISYRVINSTHKDYGNNVLANSCNFNIYLLCSHRIGGSISAFRVEFWKCNAKEKQACRRGLVGIIGENTESIGNHNLCLNLPNIELSLPRAQKRLLDINAGCQE